jgi:hypothetical protein
VTHIRKGKQGGKEESKDAQASEEGDTMHIGLYSDVVKPRTLWAARIFAGIRERKQMPEAKEGGEKPGLQTMEGGKGA